MAKRLQITILHLYVKFQPLACVSMSQGRSRLVYPHVAMGSFFKIIILLD